jgi:hypothetical protein
VKFFGRLTSKISVVIVVKGWHRAAFGVLRTAKIELSATAQFRRCGGAALKKPVPEQ